MKATVQFHVFSGMDGIPEEFETLAEARSHVAQRIKWLRKQKQTIFTIKKGYRWEGIEPEEAPIIPDHSGVLELRQEAMAECKWCGQGFYPSEVGSGIFCSEDCAETYSNPL